MIYESLNERLLPFIPLHTRRALDIGCGSGSLGKWMKRNFNCEVTGLTYSESEAILASKLLDDVAVCDLNEFNLRELGQFDCIVCSHILEHLYSPQQFLTKLRDALLPDGVLIVALPNVLFWKQRFEFVMGRFRYTNGGIMDQTHYRFFDWETSSELVKEAGFEITEKIADGHFPLPIIRSFMKPIAARLDQYATRMTPGLLGTQFIIVARRESK